MIDSVAAIHRKKNNKMLLDTIQIPDPKKDQIIIKNVSSAICGSQFINLSRTPNTPELLGHESVGTVVKIGKNIKNFKVGDEVYLSWVPSISSKKTNYLEYSEVFWNKKPINSVIFTWSEYSLVHKQFVHKKNKKLDNIYSSVLGCAGITGFGIVQKYKENIKGKKICLIGFGGIGSFIVDACIHFGALSVDVIEKNILKKKSIKEFKINDFISNINDINKKYDVVFDCVGNEVSLNQALEITRNCIPGNSEGGMIFLIGFPLNEIPFNFRNLLMQEKTIIGCRGGNIESKIFFKYIEKLVIQKKINLHKYCTNIYEFKNINNALSEFKKNKISIRGIIKF